MFKLYHSPNETQCAGCTRALIQRDTLGAISRVKCQVLGDIKHTVSQCSAFQSKADLDSQDHIRANAIVLDVCGDDMEWSKGRRTIRRNGEWVTGKARVRMVARRRRVKNPVAPAAPIVN